MQQQTQRRLVKTHYLHTPFVFPQKRTMKKFLHQLILISSLSLLFAQGGAMTAQAQVSDTYEPLIAQAFEDSTGLSNISNPSESGIQTDRLGIYGPDANGDSNLISIISNIINSVFLLLGFVAVVLLIIEGVLLILSRGNEERRKKVMGTIMNIAIGFGVILLSYAIVGQILAILGANNIQGRQGDQLLSGDQLAQEVGLNLNTNSIPGWNGASAAYSPTQLATVQMPRGNYTFEYTQASDFSQVASGDYRSVDYVFYAGDARIPALRGGVLRINKADWDKMKAGTFGLFVPTTDDVQNIKAWVKPQYTFVAPADARTVSTVVANSATGSAGRLVDLRSVLDRVQEGITSSNVVHVQIPGQTTASIAVVVVKPGEEDRFMYSPGEAFADYTSVNPTTAGVWTDLEESPVAGYDRRRSYFEVKNASSTLEPRTYTSGATIQLNNGAGDADVQASIKLADTNTLPENFQTVEHVLTRGDGVVLRDLAKSGDTVSVTVPMGQSIYVVDDMTAILKDGRRVNLGTNTISLGNNASPRFANLTSLAQLIVEGSYTDVAGAKTLRLMPSDMISLTKSGEEPAVLKMNLKYYTKEAPNLIDVVSPGIPNGFLRYVDNQVVQTGDALNNVVPYTVSPELRFEQPGRYPVAIAIRDYALGRTLATMEFTVTVVTDGTSLEVAPRYGSVVGSTYRIRTFPAFASTSALESKRVEIAKRTSSGTGTQTIVNRTLTNNQDDFDYVFDEDGEYIFTLYNKFAGRSEETQVTQSIVVMPQSPQVDFTIQEKPNNPTIFELTDLSKYVDEGTVFVEVSPYSAGQTQGSWKTVGERRVKELTFDKVGTYRVTVTGRNKYGETATRSRDVTVSTDISYDVQLLDGQGNSFPLNQTPRFVQGQGFQTRVVGKNIAKIEVSYGNNQPLLTMSNPTDDSDGRKVFTGNIQLAEQGQYALNYTFYSVTKPNEKATTVTRSVLIRRPLEPLADFSVSEAGVVLNATPGLCTVGGVSREGYKVKKNQEYVFDGSVSLASSDLPVNRDATSTTFRWNMGTTTLAAKTVSARERFQVQSTDANSCVPVTFTILENSNGQAKTAQLTKYFKVENALPTYSSFVVEWPTGNLTTPLSVRAKLRGLNDPDEPNQNIQVLWFYEIQGNQLFNEVSYDSERVVRIENYGAEGTQNVVRIGAQIYDMNTKESVKVYSDPRSVTTGTNPALRTSLVSPQTSQAISYIPWVKGTDSLRVQLESSLSDGSALGDATVAWSVQRYATFEGCSSTPESQARAVSGNQFSLAASFPLCGLYRISGLVQAQGQQSQQTLSVKVYEDEGGLSSAERSSYLAAASLRGSAEPYANYVPPEENNTSPFFATGSGSTVSAYGTYAQGLSPSVTEQAVRNGSYTGEGTRLSASYTSVYDMLASYNLPDEVIYQRLAEENPEYAAQFEELRTGTSDGAALQLLQENLSGSAIQYDPSKPYTVPFGVAYDVYAEFGLRPSSALNKVAKDDPAMEERIRTLRSSGATDESIIQSLRNEQGLEVQANLHSSAEVAPTDVVTLLKNEGLSTREIVQKLVTDNPDLAAQQEDLLAAQSLEDLLAKLSTSPEDLQFQPVAPLRLSLGRAYLVMKERAYTEGLILDKLAGDNPAIDAAVTNLRAEGTTDAAILRQLLANPTQEVNLRVASAIRSDFATIFDTLKRHGLATETIYEKMQQDDEVFRVVYEAQKEKSAEVSSYYQEFLQEPTLQKLTYKPESMFVLPLRLAYAEYMNMGLFPEQIFTRLSRDNPNLGTDYETLKNERSGGVEIFTSLVKNGANRKVRFTYMKPFSFPVDELSRFFTAQGMPEQLAMEKVIQDNPQLTSWAASMEETPNFVALEEAFPRDSFTVSPFTGWETHAGHAGTALANQVSTDFALSVLRTADSELGRLIDVLREQERSPVEIYQQLISSNEDRPLRLYPYMGVRQSLRDATRDLSLLYPVDAVALMHIARFDGSFSDFYAQALQRLYAPATTIAQVGDRTVFTPAFRPVVATAEDFLRGTELYGLSFKEGLTLYAPHFPELAELATSTEGDPASTIASVQNLYPDGQSLPMTLFVGEEGQQKIRAALGMPSAQMRTQEYLAWMKGWGISSDVVLAQLAASDPEIAMSLADKKGASIDVRVEAVEQVRPEVAPKVYKRFALSFPEAYRVYERRGLSTGMIYSFLGAQDPVFLSLYNDLRLARVSLRSMYDTFRSAPELEVIITNPLLPSDVSTLYVARALEEQGLPSPLIVKKLQADQPALSANQTSLEETLSEIARNTYLQTSAFSLIRPVGMNQQEKTELLRAYGVSTNTATELSANTGSGLTLPPQVLVDVETYVLEAQEQGVGMQQIIEDIMRLEPAKAAELRALDQQSTQEIMTQLRGLLGDTATLPLFTKAQSEVSDNAVVLYDATVDGSVVALSGYVPGTIALTVGSGELMGETGGDLPGSVIAQIQQVVRLPGGVIGYLWNERQSAPEEAFRYQNAETLSDAGVQISGEATAILQRALTASGFTLRAAAPGITTTTETANIFGLVGETTLLDCAAFSVTMTETGEQNLVCKDSTLYESSLETYRTVVLRLLGENVPEELSTLMLQFERATTLEDRLEAMDRLRERTTRLPVTEVQRQELLQRLTFIRVFDLDDTLGQQLIRRGATTLQEKLQKILTAAEATMNADRAELAQNFARLAEQAEISNVLLVRYGLLLSDVLRSQTIDPVVKDMVVDSFGERTATFVEEIRSELPNFGGDATSEIGQIIDGLRIQLQQPAYTAAWIGKTLELVRALDDVGGLSTNGAAELEVRMLTYVQSLGKEASVVVSEGISDVAAVRGAVSSRLSEEILEASIWERQRRGVLFFVSELAKETRYNAEEKQAILTQLYEARKAHLTSMRPLFAQSDFSEGIRGTLLGHLDAALASTNIQAMIEAEAPLWKFYEESAGGATSSSYLEAWKQAANFQVQMYRAATNVFTGDVLGQVEPYFVLEDRSQERQMRILEDLSKASITPESLGTLTANFVARATAEAPEAKPLIDAFAATLVPLPSTDEGLVAVMSARSALISASDLSENTKAQTLAAYEQWIRRLLMESDQTTVRTGTALLNALRTDLTAQLAGLTSQGSGMRAASHVVHDAKKLVLAHPDLPLQYKLEMLFELQHSFPFSPFARAFATCTPVYVQDASNVVRSLCLEENGEPTTGTPLDKDALFALMQSAGAQKPDLRSVGLQEVLDDTVTRLTSDKTLTLEQRGRYLSTLAQALEWPDVSYADRNAALAYVYSLPVISDEMLRLQETKLSLESFYLSQGELESRLRSIMLGVTDLPATLKGAVREALMQVKKYYTSDVQRSNVMISMAANVIRGSSLAEARKGMLVRVLDTMGDTMQPVPVERLVPEVSLEQLDAELMRLTSVPEVQTLIADREDIERLLGQNDVLGSIGALSRFEENAKKIQGISDQERSNLVFYTVVARDFQSYVQSQRPRVPSTSVSEEPVEEVVDPLPQIPTQVDAPQGTSPFWAILWGVIYVFLAILILVLCLGVALYALFLSYKRSHPDIHVDFEEYILILRGQLGTFLKRFSKEGGPSLHKVPDEPLPEMPEEVEAPEATQTTPEATSNSTPVAPPTPSENNAAVAPRPSQERAEVPPQPQGPAPSWLQIGDNAQQPQSSSVNASAPVDNVQPSQETLKSDQSNQQ